MYAKTLVLCYEHSLLLDWEHSTSLSLVRLHPASNKSKLNKVIVVLLSIYIMTVCYKSYVRLLQCCFKHLISILLSFILSLSFSRLQAVFLLNMVRYLLFFAKYSN